MSPILLDTHTWAWGLVEPAKLSRNVRKLIDEGAIVLVSPISVFEIGQKVRLKKWPQMAPILNDLPSLITELGSRIAPATPEVCLSAAMLDWEHRDPFDRILAATAIHYGAALISADIAFDTLPKGTLKRIW